MSKQLFVGSLSWSIDDDGLREAFGRFGALSEAVVVRDRATGRSRGFGFVTFESDDAADDARRAMDGATVDGRRIAVREAEQRKTAGPAPRRPTRPGSPQAAPEQVRRGPPRRDAPPPRPDAPRRETRHRPGEGDFGGPDPGEYRPMEEGGDAWGPDRPRRKWEDRKRRRSDEDDWQREGRGQKRGKGRRFDEDDDW